MSCVGPQCLCPPCCPLPQFPQCLSPSPDLYHPILGLREVPVAQRMAEKSNKTKYFFTKKCCSRHTGKIRFKKSTVNLKKVNDRISAHCERVQRDRGGNSPASGPCGPIWVLNVAHGESQKFRTERKQSKWKKERKKSLCVISLARPGPAQNSRTRRASHILPAEPACKLPLHLQTCNQ